MKNLFKMTVFVAVIFLFVSLKSECSERLIFVNTLPKSGSVYITKTIQEYIRKHSGDIQWILVGKTSFPEDQLNSLFFLEGLNENGLFITQEHIAPSKDTLEKLLKENQKFILHTRDPRQALLSWTHHVTRLCKKEDWLTLTRSLPSPPKEYLSWTLHQRVNWHIEYHYKNMLDWLEQWMKASQENPDLKLHFTSYADFLDHPVEFFQEILDFFEYPSRDFSQEDLLPKTSSLHFRKGDPNEWRRVLTEEQQKRITAMIPEELFLFFDWED